MKIKNYIYLMALGLSALGISSCENSERTFPDYAGGTTVYFANQFPVRTLVLGNDEYDNSLDLQHKCAIYATMGGAYHGRDIVLDIAVDNSLCDNLYFENADASVGAPVLPMPSEYYTLSSNTIKYDEMDKMMGKVEVQFKDAFFNDPKAIENTYVIPVVIKKQVGADKILVGEPLVEGASRLDLVNWATPAQDYVLYCVKYINPWHSDYIRRGKDTFTENGTTTIVERRDTTMMSSDKEHNKENPVNAKDEICMISTVNMTQAIFPVDIKYKNFKASKRCNLILTFSGDKCTISTNDEGITVSGSGEFITKGTEQPQYKDFQWGSLNGKLVHRDILRLDYQIDFGSVQVSTADTLVVRNRGTNKKVTFSTKYVK